MVKKQYLRIFLLLGITLFMWLGNAKEIKAYTSNLSTTRVSNNQGCNATSVYARCYFYCNVWDPDANNSLKSFTAELWKNGVKVYGDTVTATNYCNYASIPFLVTSSGSYTLKRYGTNISGGSITWDDVTATVYDVSLCPTTLTLSASSLSLNMTGTKSGTVRITRSGVKPNKANIKYTKSNSNVNCTWGEWVSLSNGDSYCDLTITGVYGGTTTIKIEYFESETNTVVVAKNISVTISPNYTISYNANGGSGAPSSQTKYYGKELTLSSTKPTRTGYDFLGWSTSSSATSATYSSGGSFSLNGTYTLYAVWKAKTYTITFNPDGGTGGPGVCQKIYGVSFVIPSSQPTREGYTFSGWSSYSGSASGIYEAGDTYSSNSDKTFYAAWKLKEYTITFNSNGGIDATTTDTKKHGQDMTIYESASRTGYEFLGWSEDKNATVAQYDFLDEYTENKSTTLYAVWQIRKYTLSYNANGGSGAPGSITAEYGTNVNISSLKPERNHYTFKGWGNSATATSATYAPGDIITLNSSNTLYAVWEADTYSVLYMGNGGTGVPDAQTKYYGTDLVLSTVEPTRTGYEFLGWSQDSGATSATYKAGATFSVNNDTVLYAIWKKEEIPVTPGTDNGDSNGDAETNIGGTSGNTGSDTGGTNGNTSTNTGGTNGSTGTNTGGTNGSTGTNTGGVIVPTVTGPQNQIITASSKNVAYKKKGTFKIGAQTSGNGLLTYKTSNKKVVTVSKTGKATIKGYGKATITITASATSAYNKATKKITIKIVPKKMSLKKVISPKKKYISATWKKDNTVTGYQMYICLRKDFKKGTYERTYKKSATKMTLKGLKSKKTYYVKIRAYKTIGKTKYYGAWSTVKRIKMK